MSSRSITGARAESSRVLRNDATMALKYLSACEASALDHAPVLWAWMMLSGVILDRKDLKILKSIVGLITIPVMDVLSARQLSAKTTFHDNTVLKLIAIIDANEDVSIPANKASRVLDASSTVHRAEANTSTP